MIDRTRNRMSIVVLPEVKTYFESTSHKLVKGWIKREKDGKKPTPSFLASKALLQHVRNNKKKMVLV